jgi:hypothetical protein
MKFAKFLLANAAPQWLAFYCDYRGLKKLLSRRVAHRRRRPARPRRPARLPPPTHHHHPMHRGEAEGHALGEGSSSPRTTSLTVGRQSGVQSSAQEAFLLALDAEVHKVSAFTERTTAHLLAAVQKLRAQLGRLPPGAADVAWHAEQAKRVGDDALQLEKFVNLNNQVSGGRQGRRRRRQLGPVGRAPRAWRPPAPASPGVDRPRAPACPPAPPCPRPSRRS